MTSDTAVLSPQELRLELATCEPSATSRPLKLLRKSKTQKPVIDVERGLCFTRSFKETFH